MEIIDDRLRGPYRTDRGDVVTLAEGAVLTGAYLGMANRTNDDINSTILIEGTVLMPLKDVRPENLYFSFGVEFWAGLELPNNPDTVHAGQTLIIEDTGIVRADYAVFMSDGGGNHVENHGRIDAVNAGFVVFTHRTSVENSGSVSAHSAYATANSDRNSFSNSGKIDAVVGVSVINGSSFWFANSGTIETQETAFHGDNLTDLSIRNSGVVNAGEGRAVAVWQATNARMDNSGTITGETVIDIWRSELSLTNTGVMRGETVVAARYGDDHVTILNRGEMIARSAAIESAGGTLTVQNSGLIRGNINADQQEAIVTLHNSGEIRGSVLGGILDDVYEGSGRGTVTGFVAGGAGNDVLTGARLRDDLRGGAGADILNGGAGRDVLTGGDGADVFVFATGFGRDVVTDFVDDVDTLELNQAIWGGGKSVRQVLDDYARILQGNVVIDFGDGNRITLEGVNDIDALLDDIVLV